MPPRKPDMRPPAPIGTAGNDAIAWWLKLSSGEASEQDQRDCDAWRGAAAENEQAWQRLQQGLAQSVGRLEPTLAQRGSSLRASLVRPARRRVLLSTAAVAGTACGAWLLNRQIPLANLAADLSTDTAQRRDFALPDGSVLTLDARSRADIDFSAGQRTIHLLAGAVIAQPQANRTTPLIINTRHGEVGSQGAPAMVRLEEQATLVVALGNTLQVRPQGQRQHLLQAGQGTRFGPDWINPPDQALRPAASWRDGLLEMHDRPLAEFVAALQPYQAGLLQVSAAASRIRISGLYPLDDTERALSALLHTTPIVLKRYTRWFTLIDTLPA
jgi:transmembrane sensor